MIPTQIQAATVTGPQTWAIAERPLPEPGPGEVRVWIEACGLCGSDLHFYHGNLMPVGHTPGHEMAGRIHALGEGVKSCAVGDRVVVEPMRSCGECGPCREGRDSVCRSLRILGVHEAGGFRQAVVVPAQRVFPIASDLPAPVAALSEPVAVAIHGLRRGSFEKGQRVLVLGSGSVGLITLVVAQAMGAGEVFISARHAHQAEHARTFGASKVLREEEASPSALDSLGRTHDIDLVVETVGGKANTLEAAVAAARPGGTISVLGLFDPPVSLNPLTLLLKESRLCWSNCYDRSDVRGPDFQRATEIVENERERLATLVTHELPLDQIGEAYRIASEKRGNAIKVSLRPAAER